jgi:hypothetical protein
MGRPWRWNEFRRYMSVAHVGAMHNRNYFERYGKFNLNYRIAGDYEMLLRANDNLKTGFVDTVIAHMQTGGASSRNNAVLFENFKAKYKNNACSLLDGIIYMIWAYFKWFVNSLRRQ